MKRYISSSLLFIAPLFPSWHCVGLGGSSAHEYKIHEVKGSQESFIALRFETLPDKPDVKIPPLISDVPGDGRWKRLYRLKLKLKYTDSGFGELGRQYHLINPAYEHWIKKGIPALPPLPSQLRNTAHMRFWSDCDYMLPVPTGYQLYMIEVGNLQTTGDISFKTFEREINVPAKATARLSFDAALQNMEVKVVPNTDINPTCYPITKE